MARKNFKQFKIYLDPENPDHQPLISFLTPYALTQRTGVIIQQALESYLSRGTPTVRMSVDTEYIPPMTTAYNPPTTTSSGTTAPGKVRGAFFK